MWYLKSLTIIFSLFCLGACTHVNAKNFESNSPKLVLEDFFAGTTRGHGIFFDRSGRARRSFVIDCFGRMEGDVFLLSEDLRYDNGENMQREYKIKKLDEHNYEANANGLVGPATIETYGNVAKWTYTLQQKISGREWNLNFDDWMYLQTDKLIINKARVTKFGIHVGDVVISIEKL